MAVYAPALVKKRDRVFYTGMAVVATAIVFAGFFRTFYLRPYFAQSRPLTALHVVHGTAFTLWILLFLLQTSLVAARRTDIHRRLGIGGGLLAAAMPILGLTLAVVVAKKTVGTPNQAEALRFLPIPFGDMLVFATVVGAAFYWRRRSEIHKRLMLVATISLLPAAIARFPFDFIQKTGPLTFFGLTDLVLLACVAYDAVTYRRLHPAYLWAGLLLIVSHPVRIMIAGTDTWLNLATWMTS